MNGKIYFVSAPGRIKIGFTRKPEIRLAQLRAVDMEDLTTIAIADGTVYIEKKLHALVEKFRIRGEWFKDCPEVRAVIEDYVSGRLVMDKYGEKTHVAEFIGPVEPPFNSAAALDFIFKAAVAEVKSLMLELEIRTRRGEDTSDLARFAVYLGKYVIAPRAHGAEKTARLLAAEKQKAA